MPLPKKLPLELLKPKNGPKTIFSNRYELSGKIGSGSFGTAYLVIDIQSRNIDKKKVLKQIHVGVLDPGESFAAMGEAKLLSRLQHENIVQFHESFLEGQFFNIVTEYCEGGDLEDRIQAMKKDGQLVAETQVIEWLKQLLKALNYMHEKRILHRDLKTRNIFVKSNKMKIGDFGISRILMGTSDMASTFVGTPYYMSPEVLKHEQYDVKCDIWSMGCVLYDICCQEHAFTGNTLMSVMVKIVSNETPQLKSNYSRGLNNVLERLLDRTPQNRPTAKEILKHPLFHEKTTNHNNNNIHMKNWTRKQLLDFRKKQAADEKYARNKQIADQNFRENQERVKTMKENCHKSSWMARQRSQSKSPPLNLRPASKSPPLNQRPASKSPPLNQRPASKSPPLPPINQRRNSKSPPIGQTRSVLRTPSRSPPMITSVEDITGVAEASPVKTRLKPGSPRSISLVERPNIDHSDKLRMIKSDSEVVTMSNTPRLQRLDSTQELIESLVRDGDIPEDAFLADTYYTQHDDFESDIDEDLSSSSDIEDESLNDEDYNEMLGCMENALHLEASTITVKPLNKLLQRRDKQERTITNEEEIPPLPSKSEDVQVSSDEAGKTSAFANTMIDNRISNLRKKCIKNLGENNFYKIYNFIQSHQPTDEVNHKNFMEEISKITSNLNLVFDVEQLIYIEQQAQGKPVLPSTMVK